MNIRMTDQCTAVSTYQYINPNDLFSTMEKNALEELFNSGHYKRRGTVERTYSENFSIPKTYARLNIDSQLRNLNASGIFKLYEERNEFKY